MNGSFLRLIWRILLSVFAIASSVVFALVNIPVVRDVAKQHLPTVIGLILVTELVVLAVGAFLSIRYDVTKLFERRLSWLGEFYCLAMAIFGCWATLRFPIWTRWGFIKRFIELKGWNPDAFQEPFYAIGVVLAVACFPVLYLGIRWLYRLFAPGGLQFIRSLTKAEWVYGGLFWGIGTFVLLAVSCQSSIFTYPMPSEPQPQGSDFPMGISVSDSALLINGDTFCNNTSSANDIRQPLFGLVCAPFAALAHLLSMAAWYTLFPNANYKLLYGIALAFWQIGAFAVVGILLKRILNEIVDSSFAWASVALYSVSYSTVLFSLTVEQYAISLLALVVFVYYSLTVRDNETDEQQTVTQPLFDVLSFCALGTLLTSVLPVFFFLGTTARSWGRIVYNFAHLILVWAILAFYTGKMGLLLNLGQRVQNLSGYADIDSSQLGPESKLLQFFHFVYATIFPAKTYYENGVVLQVLPDAIPGFILVGAGIILLLSVIGFLGAWSKRFAQLAFLWVAFSSILMGALGWGCRENGMVLYASYFAWAYIPLVCLAVYWLTGRNWKQTGTVLVSLTSLAVAVVVALALYEISFQAQDWFLTAKSYSTYFLSILCSLPATKVAGY